MARLGVQRSNKLVLSSYSEVEVSDDSRKGVENILGGDGSTKGLGGEIRVYCDAGGEETQTKQYILNSVRQLQSSCDRISMTIS